MPGRNRARLLQGSDVSLGILRRRFAVLAHDVGERRLHVANSRGAVRQVREGLLADGGRVRLGARLQL